jgi:tRNA wybutosine-synthesizing protein 2
MIASALFHTHQGSVLHVHSAGPVPHDPKETIAAAGLAADVTTRVVKKFGPGKMHFVQDIVIR